MKTSPSTWITPGKSRWCGSYPWATAGTTTHWSGTSSAARSQMVVGSSTSTSSGKCGPWSSMQPVGSRATRPCAAASLISGHVILPYWVFVVMRWSLLCSFLLLLNWLRELSSLSIIDCAGCWVLYSVAWVTRGTGSFNSQPSPRPSPSLGRGSMRGCAEFVGEAARPARMLGGRGVKEGESDSRLRGVLLVIGETDITG